MKHPEASDKSIRPGFSEKRNKKKEEILGQGWLDLNELGLVKRIRGLNCIPTGG